MAALFNDGLLGTLIGLVTSLIIGGFLGGLLARQSGPAATDETEHAQVSAPIASADGTAAPGGERNPWDDVTDLTPRVGLHRRRPGE